MAHATVFNKTHDNDHIFSTLKCSKRLIAAGTPKPQAEELAEILSEIINNNLSTKHDIELIRKDIELIRKDIERSRR